MVPWPRTGAARLPGGSGQSRPWAMVTRRLPGAPAIVGLEAGSYAVIGSLLAMEKRPARVAASIAILRREVAPMIGPLTTNVASPLGVVAERMGGAGGESAGRLFKRPYGVTVRCRDVWVVAAEVGKWAGS